MSLRERVYSLETEYAVNFYSEAGSSKPHYDDLIRGLRDVLVTELGSPGHYYLINGSKVDRDVGHMEWSLPECRSAREVVAYDLAADGLLYKAMADVEQRFVAQGHHGQLKLFKNNADFRGQTYGCHENYLTVQHTASLDYAQFLQYLIYCLTPFLVTRQILVGSGRIIPAALALARRTTFAISQRAAFIQATVSDETRERRPIINLKRESEPLAGPGFRRLHLILGDSNLSPWATWMKVGTMGIVLRMIEDQFISDVPALVNPVEALQAISLDPTCTTSLPLRNSEPLTAIDIQWHYCKLAQEYLRQFGASPEEVRLVTAWNESLERPRRRPYDPH